MKRLEGQEDLRVRRTHKFLWEALMMELSQRAFEEITVKNICERAMVHRTTFYKHYEDKYALLDQGMQQMYNTLLADMNVRSRASSMGEPLSSFILLFVHVAHHQHFYRLMLCGENVGRFQKLVKENLTEHTEIKMSALAPTNQSLAVPPAMQAQFFVGALINTVAWWLENNMPLSPEQMARSFLSLHGPLPSHCY